MSSKYKKILIANRGEIAVRINRACHELGIKTVGIYSTGDEGVLHTRLTDDKICIGSAKGKESYLNSYNIISAAKAYKVDAIHPGIGYFAESNDFAELCNNYDIDFIGPGVDTLKLMGNKIEAKKIAMECNVPIVGENCIEVKTVKDCINYINKVGLPIILKATNGGGGKGIRVVHKQGELEKALEQCKKEAESNFGNDMILIEKFVQDVKHVEVQILGDKYGNVICLGERECSLQRANQKLIEEARCESIPDDIKAKIYEDSIKISKRIKYYGPGTLEYLYLPDNTYYFIEMNTRLQVEHPITEMITGVDIVKEQIRISQGLPLNYKQKDITFNGYALECRILAESFDDDFIPCFGEVTKWFTPGGPGIRVDAGYEVGNKVTPFYDSLLAKICSHGNTKEEAVTRMLCALDEIKIVGVKTNIDFHKKILANPKFLSGEYNTSTIDSIKKMKSIQRGDE